KSCHGTYLQTLGALRGASFQLVETVGTSFQLVQFSEGSMAEKRKSLLTTGGMGRAPNRAMLRAVGFLDDDFGRPMIGVASLFSDITPCNAHLDRLARKGCEGLRAAGAVGQIFGAPTASDGIMMGHQGMRYSLVSREVI